MIDKKLEPEVISDDALDTVAGGGRTTSFTAPGDVAGFTAPGDVAGVKVIKAGDGSVKPIAQQGSGNGI